MTVYQQFLSELRELREACESASRAAREVIDWCEKREQARELAEAAR